MAITYLSSAVGQVVVRCLSTDTKPTTTVFEGAALVEEDTGKHFRYESNAWVQKINSSYGVSSTMASKTYRGRTSATAGVVEDVPVATLKADLLLVKSDVGLGSVDNTSDASKPISTATQTALDAKVSNATHTGDATGATALTVVKIQGKDFPALAVGDDQKYPKYNHGTGAFIMTAIAGGGDALVANPLSQFAATTSLQLKNTISDETGSGALVFANSPALVTPTGIVKGDVGLGSVDNTSDASKPISAATQTALDGRQPLDSDLTTIAGLLATTDNFMVAAASAWASRTPAQAKTSLALVKADVGLGSVDNTTDAGKPVSTAQQTALDLKAPLASPTFTGVPAAPTAAAGTNTTQLASTAFVTAINNNSRYFLVKASSGSHIAARVAGNYIMPIAGSPLAVGGTGTLYPLQVFFLTAADFPTVNGITTKLRVKGSVFCNDVAPTGNFTFGLHPITRPATSGGAGLVIYTVGTVVAGSNGAVVTAPAADSSTNAIGSDFAIPADGWYALVCVTTATIATSAHTHVTCELQARNT